jgi:hypothetical protein
MKNIVKAIIIIIAIILLGLIGIFAIIDFYCACIKGRTLLDILFGLDRYWGYILTFVCLAFWCKWYTNKDK